MIHFDKMQSLGNDFVVLNNLEQQLTLSPQLIQALSDRRHGIGCDQVLVVEPGGVSADFTYRIFNQDGSEVGQCGNGARCLAHFIQHHRLCQHHTITLQTLSTTLTVTGNAKQGYTVTLPPPSFAPQDLPFLAQQAQAPYRIDELNTEFYVVDVGNPHAICITTNLSQAPLNTVGTQLNQHPLWPQGCNVSWVEIAGPHTIRMRVYERGVGETQACGSAACAGAVVAICHLHQPQQLTVEMSGGSLQVAYDPSSQILQQQGPSTRVFSGCWPNL